MSPVYPGLPKNYSGHGTRLGHSDQCACRQCRRQTEKRLAREERMLIRKGRSMGVNVDLARMETVHHGSRSTYINLGCRCAPCKAANTAYIRQHRAQSAE